MRGIVAILPAFNEEVSIGSVVLRTRRYADRVIVVDDGSSDHTADVAELAGAEVIRHPENRGKGTAFGLKEGPSLNCQSQFSLCDNIMLLVKLSSLRAANSSWG